MIQGKINLVPPDGDVPGHGQATVPRRAHMAERRRAAARRRIWRLAANLLIIAGILLLAYPVSTWAYTWYEQGRLRDRLDQESPNVAVAVQAALGSPDLVQVTPGPGSGLGGTTTTLSEGGATTMTTLSPMDATRQAQLAAFRKAADDYDRAVRGTSGKPLGRLLIPSLKLDKVIIQGVDKGDLKEGPGHWPETPFPGQGGNFVISGHRTTYGAPFLKINKLKPGDEIDVVLPYAVARYSVTKTMIVDPKDTDSVAQIGREQISLAACHPIYSAKQRIVVQGDLVGFKLL
jgi:LPXTG-site transpeptidase (sortase) family protein